MRKVSRPFTTRRAFIAAALGLGAFLTARKGYDYAAHPTGEKACPPLDPEALDGLRAEGQSYPGALPWTQKGGTINDASCLNTTAIYGVVQVKDTDHIHKAVRFAQDHQLKIAIAGVRHSMGGQAFSKNAVVLDMTQFNRMSLDTARNILTVQSGATWHDIQNVLHPTRAVKAMQSTDIFTVGGSISVNAHGMDHQVGAIGKTIRAMRVMLADGSIQHLSRTENPQLFNLVIGGYGLFGIILEAELEVTANVLYRAGRRLIDYQAFPDLFAHELLPNHELGLLYGHLSTARHSFLREMLLYTYQTTVAHDAVIPPLTEVSSVKLRRLALNVSKWGALPMRLKWWAEKVIEPRLETCLTNRNQAMQGGEACLVSRNQPMHDSVPYLKNRLQQETDILHEYFIPRPQFVAFIDGLRHLIVEHRANLLNASVRVVHQEDNFLTYAPTDMFSIVLYLNLKTTPNAHERMRRVTRHLIDLTTQLGGTFFLPYQLHYTPAQLQRAYPRIKTFFEAKTRYDPSLLFTNTFYETFASRVVS